MHDLENSFVLNLKHQQLKNYSYSISTGKSPAEVFDLLLDIKKWWSGIYDETIKGSSKQPGDEFSFSAGSGMHFTKQKLVELIPYKKIVWQVTESNLSFLDNPGEWKNTQLVFDISTSGNETQLTFTHEGLTPAIECYDQCSSAWSQYFLKLHQNLKTI